MGKKALAFATADLCIPEYFVGIFTEADYQNSVTKFGNPVYTKSIFHNKTYLLDRPECESNADFMQLIPYSILKATQDGQVYIYAYSRGAGSGEQGLVGRWSIGLGGHVEEEPGNGKSLIDVLALSAQRELEEEVGLKLKLDVFYDVIAETKFIANHQDKVARVHLGLSHVFTFDHRLPIESKEEGQVDDAGWKSLEEIHQMLKDGLFEEWSKMVLEEGIV